MNSVLSTAVPSNADPSLRVALSNGLLKRVEKALAKNPTWLIVAWIAVFIAFLTVPVIAYFSWWLFIPKVAAWPASDWAALKALYWVLAALGILFLCLLPVWYAMLPVTLLKSVTEASLLIEEKTIEVAQTNVKEHEAEILSRYESSDDVGLLPLLTYSRAQLEAYYDIGLGQTRRSFFHGVVSMWLGFCLLLAGLALYILPLPQSWSKPTTEFTILVTSASVIIEFISALFLWMYRSTTGQLTYLYDRQMYSHTAVLCFRMASKIDSIKGDETRAFIVKKLLDWSAKPERPALIGGGGMAALVGKKAPVKEAE